MTAAASHRPPTENGLNKPLRRLASSRPPTGISWDNCGDAGSFSRSIIRRRETTGLASEAHANFTMATRSQNDKRLNQESNLLGIGNRLIGQ